MGERVFRNRHEAGRVLAEALSAYRDQADVIVLALPRGGVPVAYEVAAALHAPLDVFVVRKLGVPGAEELAMGAIATGGALVLNEDVVNAFRISERVIEATAADERRELVRREREYRDGRGPPDVRNRTVILVDDGLATGASMLAAIKALRTLGPKRIVAAVPVASSEVCEQLKKHVDEVVCALTPPMFHAVGYWYDDFSQTSDDEVRDLLARSRGAEGDKMGSNADADDRLVEAIRQRAHRLTGVAGDYDPLMSLMDGARFALLGEASHGTHEFYRERARITRRLIEERGYTAVAVEADWPDAYRVNRYVQGVSDDVDATEALADFRRFPTWMWRNAETVAFVEWLRSHNDKLAPGARKVGFYGLDLYSLRSSMKLVIQILEKIDPEAARRARERYACFDRFENEQVYGLITGSGATKSCEEEVVRQLVEMQHRSMQHTPGISEDEIFHAEQNARLVKNAERYYRAMFVGDVPSWNLRDQHMAETFEALVAHLGRQGVPAKIAVWEHNSHLGDARATQMAERGELNVGQLIRQKYQSAAVLVGFTTHHGTVTAASEWGGPAERERVRPALQESYEALFHRALPGRFLLSLADRHPVTEALRHPRLERAIGVIYRPETERISHYFRARLADQFDAVIHFDETQALEPLERTSQWEAGEVPETFPSAL